MNQLLSALIRLTHLIPIMQIALSSRQHSRTDICSDGKQSDVEYADDVLIPSENPYFSRSFEQ